MYYQLLYYHTAIQQLVFYSYILIINDVSLCWLLGWHSKKKSQYLNTQNFFNPEWHFKFCEIMWGSAHYKEDCLWKIGKCRREKIMASENYRHFFYEKLIHFFSNELIVIVKFMKFCLNLRIWLLWKFSRVCKYDYLPTIK